MDVAGRDAIYKASGRAGQINLLNPEHDHIPYYLTCGSKIALILNLSSEDSIGNIQEILRAMKGTIAVLFGVRFDLAPWKVSLSEARNLAEYIGCEYVEVPDSDKFVCYRSKERQIITGSVEFAQYLLDGDII